MALQLSLSNVAANAEADAFARLLDTGYLRIYSGSQPATCDTAIGAQVLLATLRFSATSAPAASAGVLTMNAITSDTNAAASGTAAWYRTFKSDGTTAVSDGSVGTATTNCVINSTAISAGATVSCSSFTHTVPKT